jgi:arginyl-tRNA synthetase
MMSLTHRFQCAFNAIGLGDFPLLFTEASRPVFGDYQINGVLAAAKALKQCPIDAAHRVLAAAKIEHLAECSVVAPGFINVRLQSDYLQSLLTTVMTVPPIAPQTVVVDYASPNLAKPMHVGHLRSAILGDALVRVLSYLGHHVIRCNHVGDWGTPMGMMLAYGHRFPGHTADYQHARTLFDTDSEFTASSHQWILALQSRQDDALRHWQALVLQSLDQGQKLYERLGLLLTRDDVKGESTYYNELSHTVSTLREKNLAVQSKGAWCIFTQHASTPFIIQKEDGSYLYATTDLAALQYRVQVLGAQRILYVVDTRQAHHFLQLFNVAQQAGWVKDVQLQHVAFGTLQNSDGKPFKSRDGSVVLLNALLDRVVDASLRMVRMRHPDWSPGDSHTLACTMAINAIKYNDLCKHRTTDVLFNVDQMLALDGNTAPYIMYAVTRIQHILQHVEGDGVLSALEAPSERALAILLINYMSTVQHVAETYCPHGLCQYLLRTAHAVMRFYEQCPVRTAEKAVQQRRIYVLHVAYRVLTTGMSLLGLSNVSCM